MNTQSIIATEEDQLVAKLRLVKKQRVAGKFFERDIPYTNRALLTEISSLFGHLDKNISIAVLYTVEEAIYLSSIGYHNITLITKDYDKCVERWAEILNMEYVLIDKVEADIKDKKKMKFDVVIGNPPYTNSVWRPILVKMLELANNTGIICSINPDSTMNHSTVGKELRELFLANGIQIKKNCASAFPDVSMPSISYILFNKALAGVHEVFTPDSVEFSVASKVLALKTAELMINSGKTETAKLRKAEKLFDTAFPGSRQIVESVAKTSINFKFIDAADEKPQSKSFNATGRVLITYQHFGINPVTPVYEIADISTYAYSINIHIIKIDDNETIEGFNSVYLSKLYRFVLNQLRGSHTMTRFPYIKALPKLDLSRVWMPDELYDYFNLTQDEIDYIEATIK